MSTHSGEFITSRITKVFDSLSSRSLSALIPFIVGGYPDYDTSLCILKGLPARGADIIEIGMPFSDPFGDGLVIQEASGTALRNGASINMILNMVRDFRETNIHTPIVLMGYYNPVRAFGGHEFVHKAKQAGVDSFIIVDLPPEEDNVLFNYAANAGVNQVRLITPATTDKRLTSVVLPGAMGFMYYVTFQGVTGTKTPDIPDVLSNISRIKKITKSMPICAGFGVQSVEHARSIASIADGVIVGSKIINIIKDSECIDNVFDFVQTLSSGLHSA